MSLLEEKVKGLEFPLVEDADGEEYGEGTWSNAVVMVKALAGDGFTLIRRNRNRVRLGTFFCSVMDKRLFPNAQAVLPALCTTIRPAESLSCVPASQDEESGRGLVEAEQMEHRRNHVRTRGETR